MTSSAPRQPDAILPGLPHWSGNGWPEPVPYIFKHGAMQLLQQPDKVTILYGHDHQFRA
jgi:hypothetical protein